ncbi:MAG: hypothetical protein V3R82_01660 [Candidatus Hydrothermarchaeales archaeon]
MGIEGIANQVDLLLTLVILGIGLGIFINIRNLDLEKLKKRAMSKKGMNILWMDSTILGTSFLLHQLTWALETYMGINTGIWLAATKTLFIASLGFLTLTWYEIVKDSAK